MTNRILRHLLLAAFLPTLSACSDIKAVNVLNAVIPAIGYELSESIAYGNEPRQAMDIYHPTSPAENHQLIVFVYGGAWREGNRSEYEFVGQALSNAGHTVVIPDYRLYPDVVFPDFVNDVALAIASLPEQASLSSINTRSIVLMGHSSGAHSAALLSTDKQYLSDSGVEVIAFIGLSGPYDLPLENKEVIPVFANNLTDSVKPVKLVDETHPPALLIHGLSDKRVVPRHTHTFTEALQRHNIPVTTHLEKSGSHIGVLASIAAPLRFTADTMQHVLAFLSEHN